MCLASSLAACGSPAPERLDLSTLRATAVAPPAGSPGATDAGARGDVSTATGVHTPAVTARDARSGENGEAESIAAAARQKCADDLDIPADEVTALAVEAVEWPDSSLGCPEPGNAYLQVLTPGYRVVLEAGGQQVTYHTDRRDPPNMVRCSE